MLFLLVSAFVFILGLIFGSFFNVCIHRFPREQSIVWPGSKCPSCGKSIAWYDNVPILSFLILGGCCRNCKSEISHRYWAVEAVCGFFFLWIWFYFGPTGKGLTAVILFSLLFVATVVDIEHQIIPDEVSLGGMIFGLLLSTFIPSLHHELIWWRSLIQSFIGLLAGGGVIYLTGTLGNWIFRKDSMGGGDIKLLAMLGSFLGWQKVLMVYFLAPVLALPPGLFLRFVKRKEMIPFGPFLSLAGWLAFLFGDQFIAWYFHRLQF